MNLRTLAALWAGCIGLFSVPSSNAFELTSCLKVASNPECLRPADVIAPETLSRIASCHDRDCMRAIVRESATEFRRLSEKVMPALDDLLHGSQGKTLWDRVLRCSNSHANDAFRQDRCVATELSRWMRQKPGLRNTIRSLVADLVQREKSLVTAASVSVSCKLSAPPEDCSTLERDWNGDVHVSTSRAPAQESGSKIFPPGFYWGFSTSAYQIEGGNTNSDWWNWENRPGFMRTPDRSGAAADHWNRLEEDTRLLTGMGVNMHRLGVEWARIEPRDGVFDPAALEHYRREIQLLRAAHIEPMVTLWHWTFPQWVRDRGGWDWDELPRRFAVFTQKVYETLGDQVQYWLTLNEPTGQLAGGYISGENPPQVVDFSMSRVRRPLNNMIRAHIQAYDRLHSLANRARREVKVGLANSVQVFNPRARTAGEQARLFGRGALAGGGGTVVGSILAFVGAPLLGTAAFVAGHTVEPVLLAVTPLTESYLAGAFRNNANWVIVNAIETGHTVYRRLPPFSNIELNYAIDRPKQDFFGINHYNQFWLSLPFPDGAAPLMDPRSGDHTEMGWQIYPEGMFQVLREAQQHAPRRDIIITENGAADPAEEHDELRQRYLRAYLSQVHRAIQAGVPVKGYLQWSILDNFEWREGYSRHFGVYRLDRATQQRIPRDSVEVYRRIIRDNGLRD